MHFKFRQFGKSGAQKQLVARQETLALQSAYRELEDALHIEEQALEELESSTPAWESRFTTWKEDWRKGLEELSFEHVRHEALKARTDIDSDIYSLIAPPTNGSVASIDFNLNRETGHAESGYAEAGYAEAYLHYASSVSSMDLNTPAPDASYEVSIIGDDYNYAELAREIPPSQQSKLSQTHAYHGLIV